MLFARLGQDALGHCCCLGISTTAFGSTGQTYSQLPHPSQNWGFILIPTPGLSLIACGLQLTTQAEQLLLRARQRSLNASATMSGRGSDGGGVPCGVMTDTAGRCTLSVPAISSAAFPSEESPCRKKSLREMLMTVPLWCFILIISMVFQSPCWNSTIWSRCCNCGVNIY
jgi:hypothetical protein